VTGDQISLAPGAYDVYWYQGYGHKSIRLASNITVVEGELTEVHANSGVRRTTAPEFARFGTYGQWVATAVGDPYEHAVQTTPSEAMLLAPGEYDIHWYQGFGHKPIRISSGLRVSPGALVEVAANSGLRRITAPEFAQFQSSGQWVATVAGDPYERAVQTSTGEAMLLPPGEYDVYWYQGFGHRPICISRGVRVSTGSLAAVAANSGVRRITAPEFAHFQSSGQWVATVAGDPYERAVQTSTGEAMLLPPGEYDIYWYQGYGFERVLLASRVEVREGAIAPVHADSGIRLVHEKAPPQIDSNVWWGVTAPDADPAQPTHMIHGKFEEALLLAPGVYDVVWRESASTAPTRLAAAVIVEISHITDVQFTAAVMTAGMEGSQDTASETAPPSSPAASSTAASPHTPVAAQPASWGSLIWVIPVLIALLVLGIVIALLRRRSREARSQE